MKKRAGDCIQEKLVKTVCNMCSNHCGINAYVRDGKIDRIEGMQEHPFHNLCVKPYAIPEMVHSAERLVNPLKKENGKFREMTWDEAFGFLVDRLTDIRRKYGAEATVLYLSTAVSVSPLIKEVARRFADIYGTPNFTTAAFTCFLARVIGSVLTCGTYPNPDFHSADTRCMVIWGKNPPESFASERDAINLLMGRGAKLVVVDPRRTSLAKKSNIHAQIRPGTDCALALGLLNVIITEKLYDDNFVEHWTVGFDKLIEHVKEFTPQTVERITWVPAETVKSMARMYAASKPACIDLGISLEHSSNGIQTIRAINALIAITGNLDISGGNLILPGLTYKDLRLKERIHQTISVGDGYPLFNKIVRAPSASSVTNIILSEKPYPIKALLVVGSNPLLTWPNTSLVKRAFEKLELLCVIDTYMTDTAQMADLVLPGTTFLETDELRDIYFSHEGIPLIVKSNKVIEPVGNAMEDWKIWAELAKRMGYEEYFPWKDSDDLISDLLKPTNITLDRLKQNPGGIYYTERMFRKYLRDGFNTPSGKVELFSETMAHHGYDPMPTFHEPVESPLSQPDIKEEYPFILMTGPRTQAYTHSRFRNLPSLRRLYPEPIVEINSQSAQGLGINNGDMVRVDTLRGSIKVKAHLTEHINPQVVSVLHGWSIESGANANWLTDNNAVDPVSSFPEHRAVLCRVERE
jgi:anaerobic selenocysteine-containing dehydrogenase